MKAMIQKLNSALSLENPNRIKEVLDVRPPTTQHTHTHMSRVRALGISFLPFFQGRWRLHSLLFPTANCRASGSAEDWAAGLQESAPLGDAVSIERQALEKTYDQIIQKGIEELSAAKSSGDFNKMSDALLKFENYPGDPKGDAKSDAKAARKDLQEECDKLLETTKETLRTLMSSQSPFEIDTELAKYSADFGPAINEESKALAERKTNLFRQAQTEMQQLASDKDAPIEDLDKMLETYAEWPSDTKSAWDALKSAKDARLRDITKQASDFQQSGDYAGCAKLLETYGPAMEKYMKDTHDTLTRSQTTMLEQMQVTLKEGQQSSDPDELAALIEQSQPFGEALQAERKGLESRVESVIKKANDDMTGLIKSDDYPEISATMAQYEKFPADTKEAHEKLAARAEEVLEVAKQKLRDLLASQDPNEIKEKLEEYDKYEDAVKGERDTLLKRRTQLIDDAKAEMAAATGKLEPLLYELNDVIDKYKDYPEEAKASLDALKTKKSQVIAKVRDDLTSGRSNDDVAAVDKLLADFKERPDMSEEVKEQFDALTLHRTSLQDNMQTKMKEGGNKFETPDPLEELITASEIYGEGLEGERKALRQQIEKLTKAAIDDMKGAVKSEDYTEVTRVLTKFQSWPEETRETWKELEKHSDEVVDNEKKMLRDLAQTEDPNGIDDGLVKAALFPGDRFREEQKLCQDRRDDLIQTAKQEMSQLSATRAPPIEEINALLLKYENYPDIRKEKDGLKSKLSMTTTNIRDSLVRATKSKDVVEIDKLLEEHAPKDPKEEVSALLKDAIDNLSKRRKDLDEEMAGKLKEGTKLEDPAEVKKLLTSAEPYGESISKDVTGLQGHLDKLISGASDDVKKLLTSEDFAELDTAMKKYEKWPAEFDNDRQQLTKRFEGVVDSAKNGLLDGCDTGDPAEVTEILDKYKAFGEIVKVERETLERRHDDMMDAANKEMKGLAERENITEVEISEMLEKYKEYPVGKVRQSKDALKARQVLFKTTIHDRMRRLASKTDVTLKELDDTLEEYKGREDLSESMKLVEERRKTLMDDIGAKLKSGSNLEDPVEIIKIIEEASVFGDAVASEVKGLNDQKDKLIKTAIDEMKKLETSEDFVEINASLKKYESWPDECQQQLGELRKRGEMMVDTAKDKLFELCSGTDPLALKDGLAEYDNYGHAIDEQRRAVETRRKQLFTTAAQEMMDLSRKQDAPLEDLQAALEKYDDPAYPESAVGSSVIALKRALNRASSTMGAELTRLIVDRITDVALIDSTLDKYEAMGGSSGGGDASGGGSSAAAGKAGSAAAGKAGSAAAGKAGSAASKGDNKGGSGGGGGGGGERKNLLQGEIDDLKKYRLSLEEAMKTRLKEASSLEHPNEVRDLLADAEPYSAKGPYGDGLEADIKTAVSHEEKLVKNAKDEIGKLTKGEDFPPLHDALEKYGSYPEESMQTEMDELRKKHDDMVTEAKTKLLELCDADDPASIGEEIEKYAIYGDVVETQRAAASKRIDEIVAHAVRDMKSLQSRPEVTIQEIQAMEDKYRSFPQEVKSGIDVLKGMKRSALTGAKDRMRALMQGKPDVKAIDAWLEEMTKTDDAADVDAAAGLSSTASSSAAADKPGAKGAAAGSKAAKDAKGGGSAGGASSGASAGGGIAELMKVEIEEMTNYRKKIEDDIKALLKKLAAADDPLPMVEALVDSDAYGEAVATEKKECEDKKEKLVTEAKEEIKKLMSGAGGGGSTASGGAAGGAAKDAKGGAAAGGAKAGGAKAGAAGGSASSSSETKGSESGGGGGLNYAEIAAALEKYKLWPEELKESVDELKTFCEETVEKAKDSLLELMESADPNHIVEELAKYDSYGGAVNVGIEAAKKRLKMLADQATQEIQALVKKGRDPPATLQDIDALTVKYDAYPPDMMKDSMDALKSAKVLISSSLRDSMTLLLKNKDIKAIDKYLKQYAPAVSTGDSGSGAAKPAAGAGKDTSAASKETGKDAAGGASGGGHDPIAEMMKELQDYRKQLFDDIVSRLKEGTSLESPAELQKLLDESKDYGEEIEKESKPAQDHMDKMISTASDELKKLVKSEELTEVLEALKKYDGWDGAKEAYAELDKWKEEMIGEAKNKLLALCGSPNPKEIDEQLPLYEKFGEAIEQQLAAVHQRRADLIANANKEMEKLANKDKVEVSEIEALLAKYTEENGWSPEETGQGQKLLTNLMNAKATAAADDLRALASSKDVAAIDAAIEANLESQLDGVKDAAEELKKYRQTLEDEMASKLKEALTQLEIKDPLQIIPQACEAMVEAAKAYGKGMAGEIKSLEDHLGKLYTAANDDMKELLKSDDTAAVAAALAKYESWPEDVKEQRDSLKNRLEELVMSTRMNLGSLTKSEDYQGIVEGLASTESLESFLSAERSALNSRRKDLLDRAKIEMQSLISRERVSAHEITITLDKFADYPSDVRDERDALKAKQALVISQIKDSLRNMKTSEDVRAIDAALRDAADLIEAAERKMAETPTSTKADTSKHKDSKDGKDGKDSKEASKPSSSGDAKTNMLAEALKDVIAELEEHKKDLAEKIKTKMKDGDQLDDVDEIAKLIEQAEYFGEAVESERKALIDRQNKLLETVSKELLDLAQTDEYIPIDEALKKHEKYGGVTEVAWNKLHLHLDDLTDTAKREMRALIKSKDAVEIMVVVDRYNAYGDAIGFERAAVVDHCSKLYGQVVQEMQHFALKVDVTHMDAHQLLDKYQEWPIELRKGRDAVNLKMRQIFASVADRLLFLLESKSVFEIDMALEEAKSIEQSHIDRTSEKTGPLVKELEQLETHRKGLSDALKKKLVDGVKSEDPRSSQILLDEAKQFGEDLKAEATELKRRQDTLIATACQELKALTNSDDFREISTAVKKYDGFHPETHNDWSALRARMRSLVGYAKLRLQKLKTSEDPADIQKTISEFEGVEDLVREDLRNAKEAYSRLVEMARADMNALAKSLSPTFKEIERLMHRYQKYPEDVTAARESLQRRSDLMAEEVESKIRVASESSDFTHVISVVNEYDDAGERFIVPLAALKKRRMVLVQEMEDKMKEFVNSQDPFEIEKTLDDSTHFGEDVRAFRQALINRKRDLIEEANLEMERLKLSDDFTAISVAIAKYEKWGESTKTRWRALREHWVEQLETVKLKLRDLISATEPDEIDKFLKQLEGFDESKLSLIAGEQRQVMMRREALIEQANRTMRQLATRDTATIADIEEARKVFASYPNVEDARKGLEIALEQAADRARMELKTALELTDVKQVDRVLEKHKAESGELLQDLVDEVSDHRSRMMLGMLEKLEEVVDTEDVTSMADLAAEGVAFGTKGAIRDAVLAVQDRRVVVVRKALDTLHSLANSSDNEAIARAMAKYKDFSDETKGAYAALNERWEGLIDVAKAQLLATVNLDDPHRIQSVVERYAKWGGDIAKELDKAQQKLDEVVEIAIEDMNSVTKDPYAKVPYVESLLKRYATYPEKVWEPMKQLAKHLEKRISEVEDELALLRETTEILKVTAAIEEHKGSSTRLEGAVNDLEFHMMAMATRMREKIQACLVSSTVAEIDAMIEEAKAFGDQVDKDRQLLTEHRRKVMRAAAEAIAELTLSDDFNAVEVGIEKFEKYPDEITTHLDKLKDHRGKLLSDAKTQLTELRASTSIDHIDQQIKKFLKLYGKDIQADIDAVSTRKNDLLSEARNEMETLAKDKDASIESIELMIQKFEHYPRDIRKSRDQLKTRLAVLVAEISQELRKASKSSDFRAVNELLDKYSERPSTHIAGVIADVRGRQANLIVEMKKTLRTGSALDDPREMDKLLELATPFGRAVRNEVKDLQERRQTRIRAIRNQLKRLTKASDFAAIKDAVETYKGYTEDLTVEWDALREYRDTLLETAKKSLAQLSTADDPSYIAFELRKFEVYGEFAAAEVDDVKARKRELVSTAQKEIDKILADPETTMRVLGEKLVMYQSYPDIEAQRVKMSQKLETLVNAGKQEIIAAMESKDLLVVVEILQKHEASGEYLDSSLATLEQQKERLERRTLDRLETTLTNRELTSVKVVLDETEKLSESSGLVGMIGEVKKHYDTLRQDMIKSIEEVGKPDAQKPDQIAKMLLKATDHVLDDDLSAKFNELRSKYATMLDNVRDKILDAKAKESPEDMAEVMKEAHAYGEDLAGDAALLADRRSALLESANKELRDMAFSTDFQAVTEAVTKFKDFAPETTREFQRLSQHYEEMVENAKKDLRAQLSSTDPNSVAEVMTKYTPYGSIVDVELKAATDKHGELLADAKKSLSSLAQVDAATNLDKISSALEMYRSYPEEIASERKTVEDLLAKAVSQYDDILRHAGKTSNVKEVDEALEKCKVPGLEEYLSGSIADVTKHRNKLEQTMSTRMREALKSKVPKDIMSAIDDAAEFGASLANDRKTLQSHYQSVSKGLAKEMRQLTEAVDYHKLTVAIDSYTDVPTEIQGDLDRLKQHKENLLELAKQDLRELVAASSPFIIDETLARLTHYGDLISSEKAEAMSRRTEIINKANSELEAVSKKEDATLLEVEQLLSQFEGWPKDIRKARDSVKTRQAVAAAKLMQQIKQSIESRDYALVEDILAKHSQTAGSQLAPAITDLRNKQTTLINGMKLRIKTAIATNDLAEMDKAAKEAEPYGAPLKMDIDQLTRRRAGQVDSLKARLTGLAKVEDFAAVVQAIEKYDDHPSEVQVEFDALKSHRDALIDIAQRTLKEAKALTEPTQISLTIERYSSFNEFVMAEREDAQGRFFQLMDDARNELEDSLAQTSVDIPGLSLVISKYDGWPREIQDLRQQVRAKVARVVSQGAGLILQALRSADLEKIDQVLEKYGGQQENFQSEIADLKAHRAALVKRMAMKMTSALSMVDPRQIQNVLDDAEHFNTEVDKERKFLEDKKQALLKDAIAELTAAVKSDDFREVSYLIRKYDGYPDEAAAHWETLKQVKDDMVEIAKSSARDVLAAAKQPRDFDAQIPTFDQYGVYLEPEVRELKAAKEEMLDTIRREFKRAAKGSIEDMDAVLDKYAEYSDDDIGIERGELQAARYTAYAIMEEQLRFMCKSKDIQPVDDALAKFAPYEHFVEDAYLDLTRHREKLVGTLSEDIMAAIQLDDPRRIVDVLQQSKAFEQDVTKEIEALHQRFDVLIKQISDEVEDLVRSGTYAEVLEASRKYKNYPAQVAASLRDLENRQASLIREAKEKILSVCTSSDPTELQRCIEDHAIFGEDVVEERSEAVLRRIELLEVAATDMESWVHDATATMWMMSEVLQKYTKYPNEETVAWARDKLQEKLATAISGTNQYITSALKSDDVSLFDTLLRKHAKDKDLILDSHEKLQARRRELQATLSERISTALHGDDAWEVNRLAELARKARLDGKVKELEEKFSALVSAANSQMQDLLLSDDYIAIIAAVEKYSNFPDSAREMLTKLQAHSQKLQEEARTYLREQSQRATDPIALEQVLQKYEVFGDSVSSTLHAVKIRSVNLVEAARRELTMLSHKAELSLEQAETALAKYEGWPGGLGPELEAVHARIEGMVTEVAEQALRSKEGSNLEELDAVLVRSEQLLSRYNAEALAQLRGARQDMVSGMQTEIHRAIATDDPREMLAVLGVSEQYGVDVTTEREQLQSSFDIKVKDIAAELTAATESTDLLTVAELLGTYRGYPSELKDELRALAHRRDELIMEVQARVSSRLAESEDPAEILEIIDESKGYGDAVQAQVADANAKRLRLLREARTEMQRLLHDPNASLEGMAAVRDKYADWPYEVQEEHTNLKQKLDSAIIVTGSRLREAGASNDVGVVDQLLVVHKTSAAFLEPLYSGLQAHREQLTRLMQAEMVDALATVEQAASVDSLLERAAAFGDEVQSEVTRLKYHRENLIDAAIDDMHSLLESENYELVTAALQQYEACPRAAKAAWLALRQHQGILLNMARQEITICLASDDVLALDSCYAKFQIYSDNAELEHMREQLLNRKSELHRIAEQILADLLQAPESASAARQMQEALSSYTDYTGIRVEAVRSRVHERYDKLVRAGELELRAALRTTDARDVDAVLVKHADHTIELARTIAEVKVHRSGLLEALNDKMKAAASSDDPRRLASVIAESRPFGSDVAVLREAVEGRYAAISNHVIANLSRLSRTDDWDAISAAIERYAGYPKEFQPALESLKHHGDALIADAKGTLGQLRRSEDVLEMDAAAEKYAAYGRRVLVELEDLRAARCDNLPTNRSADLDHLFATQRGVWR